MRFLLCVALLLTAAVSRAQLVPLGGDPSRAAEAAARDGSPTVQRPAALTLPFFDDFTTPRDGLPRADNWAGRGPGYPQGDGTTGGYGGGGAYVSNRLAVDPPSRGAVTLDGLRANGLPYTPGDAFATGATDTLTSQAIDLSGLNVGSNVYLSFAWQAGAVLGPTNASSGPRPVGLVLEFLSSSGLWNRVWSFTSPGSQRTNFRQQIFPLNQAGYFFSGFRFRFRALGNQNTNQDSFGLDYLYLNSNRTAADTVFRDVATSRPLGNPLRRFTSMPAWQFAAASSSELSTSAGTTLNRLTAPGVTPLPVSWQGVVRELGGPFGPAGWLSGGTPLPGAARQEPVTGNPSAAPLPTTSTPRTYRYQVSVATAETSPLTLPNDSISRDVTLADYYAFDDGTAEAGFFLLATQTGGIGYFAYALDLNKNDAVKSVRLSPIFNNILTGQPGGENYQNRPVTIAVWSDNNGRPGTLLASRQGTLLNPLNPANARLTIPAFQEIAFDQPVAVTGRCYVGYGQAATGQFLPYGFDLNNVPPANVAFEFANGSWAVSPLSSRGAVLVRAVLTNGVMASRAAAALSERFSLYPNPGAAGTTVTVEGPAFRQAALLDVLGRTVWQQPAAEAGRPALRLPAGLPAGLYLVQLTLADGQVATRRLTVE